MRRDIDFMCNFDGRQRKMHLQALDFAIRDDLDLETITRDFYQSTRDACDFVFVLLWDPSHLEKCLRTYQTTMNEVFEKKTIPRFLGIMSSLYEEVLV